MHKKHLYTLGNQYFIVIGAIVFLVKCFLELT